MAAARESAFLVGSVSQSNVASGKLDLRTANEESAKKHTSGALSESRAGDAQAAVAKPKSPLDLAPSLLLRGYRSIAGFNTFLQLWLGLSQERAEAWSAGGRTDPGFPTPLDAKKLQNLNLRRISLEDGERYEERLRVTDGMKSSSI
jgi:hypothetical protein